MSILKLKNKNGQWEEVDSLIGKEGPAGPSNSLSIGTVEKGEIASATITGNSPNQELNLVLPKGDAGPQGETGPKPIKGEDYFTSEDIEELNVSGIEKYVLLSDMSSSAPEITALNSKYYNTSNKLIYSAIDEENWSDFTETPKKNVFYINTKDGAMYYWNGTDMILIMPVSSLCLGICTEEELEKVQSTEECLIGVDKMIKNPKIPRYEKEAVTFTIKNTDEVIFSNAYKKFPFDTTSDENSKKFILQEDGTVKIGKGVAKIAVSGSTSLSGVSETQIRRLSIFKNDTIANRTQMSYGGYQSFLLAPKIVDVTEGDIISMQITGSNNPSGTASCGTEITFMTLQEV